MISIEFNSNRRIYKMQQDCCPLGYPIVELSASKSSSAGLLTKKFGRTRSGDPEAWRQKEELDTNLPGWKKGMKSPHNSFVIGLGKQLRHK